MLVEAILGILKIATDPKVIDLAHKAMEQAFNSGECTEAEYQASIKARDDAWARLNRVTDAG